VQAAKGVCTSTLAPAADIPPASHPAPACPA
jgi:hypothetical protein